MNPREIWLASLDRAGEALAALQAEELAEVRTPASLEAAWQRFREANLLRDRAEWDYAASRGVTRAAPRP